VLTLIPDVSCETAVVECLMDLFKRPIDPISTWRALSCTGVGIDATTAHPAGE